MTTREPAPRKLELPNRPLTIYRDRDKEIRFVQNKNGLVLLKLEQDEWEDVRDFFIAITDPGALL